MGYAHYMTQRVIFIGIFAGGWRLPTKKPTAEKALRAAAIQQPRKGAAPKLAPERNSKTAIDERRQPAGAQ
jgi:hypothetical protein